MKIFNLIPSMGEETISELHFNRLTPNVTAIDKWLKANNVDIKCVLNTNGEFTFVGDKKYAVHHIEDGLVLVYNICMSTPQECSTVYSNEQLNDVFGPSHNILTICRCPEDTFRKWWAVTVPNRAYEPRFYAMAITIWNQPAKPVNK